MRKLLLPFLLLIGSCSYITEYFDQDEPGTLVNYEGKNLNILFSHNINGETHPCGCRHHPLGGLPQVAGHMAVLKKNSNIIYVDSGDTLFPSSSLPSSLRQSLMFGAENLAKGLSDMGLQYMVPGDQDFAGGIAFLQKILKQSKFHFLISNLKDPKVFKHKKWFKISSGPHKFYFTGVVFKDVLAYEYTSLFSDETSGVKNAIAEMKKDGYNPKDNFHRLYVISSGGIDNDEQLAKNVPEIDWVIGGHSQKFTQEPLMEGKTHLVQVLSRNHYLGQIQIDIKKDKKADKFSVVEIREDLSKNIEPNPWNTFIDNHKKKMTEIQKKEQEDFVEVATNKSPYDTSASCMDCHSDQADHWQKTPHSIAYATLIKAKESFNMQCIKCHAVGTNDDRGFHKTSKIIKTRHEVEKKLTETEKLKKIKAKYWQELNSLIAPIKSVREMKPSEIEKVAKSWHKLDEKHEIMYNFANVQCLNCHSTDEHHPFESTKAEITKEQNQKNIKNKCLTCHTNDQSPEWYTMEGRGPVDEKVLEKMYHKMSH